MKSLLSQPICASLIRHVSVEIGSNQPELKLTIPIRIRELGREGQAIVMIDAFNHERRFFPGEFEDPFLLLKDSVQDHGSRAPGARE